MITNTSTYSIPIGFTLYFDFINFIYFSEKLAGIDLGQLTEVTQSVDLQKQKLGTLLEEVNKLLALPLHGSQSWNVELIHSKHLPAILHLLVSLAKQYNCPQRLPNNVIINVVVVQVNIFIFQIFSFFIFVLISSV